MIKGIVYKLKCNKTNLFYIGSTTQILNQRQKTHRSKYNSSSSKIIIDNNDYEYTILEDKLFNSLQDLRALENLYIIISKNKFSDRIINKRNVFFNKEIYKKRRSELNKRRIFCPFCNKELSFKSKYKHNKIYHSNFNN
jgi:hypothetical protein